MSSEFKSVYLGDGVYAGVKNGMILLTTSSHIEEEADNKIFLEPEVLTAFIKYIKQLNGVTQL